MLENGRMKVPVGIIVHTRQHLNNALAQDRYFFVDVARDGIALYQDDDKPLPRPRHRTAASALEMAREYVDAWFAGAGAFYDAFAFNLGLGSTMKPAYYLHTTFAKHTYAALLLNMIYSTLKQKYDT